MATAETLFSRHGILNTSTALIAKMAKVSHGALFMHFPTRDHLISAVIDEFGTKLSQAFDNRLTNEGLEACLKSHLSILSEREDFYFALVSEMKHLPKAARGLFYMINSAVSWRVFQLAKTHIETGKIKKLGQAQIFNTWAALIQYSLLNRDVMSQKRPILKEKSQELVSLFLTLIST